MGEGHSEMGDSQILYTGMGNGEQGNILVEGVKAIKCFHPRMLTPLMARVNTN